MKCCKFSVKIISSMNINYWKIILKAFNFNKYLYYNLKMKKGFEVFKVIFTSCSQKDCLKLPKQRY